MPDQMPVPHRRKRPAALGRTTGDPESAPGSRGPVVSVPVFLLPACTPESVDPPMFFVGENTYPESNGEERE